MNDSNNLPNYELDAIKKGLKNYNLDSLFSELFYLNSPEEFEDSLQKAYYYIAEWCASDQNAPSDELACTLIMLRSLITALKRTSDIENRQIRLVLV